MGLAFTLLNLLVSRLESPEEVEAKMRGEKDTKTIFNATPQDPPGSKGRGDFKGAASGMGDFKGSKGAASGPEDGATRLRRRKIGRIPLTRELS